MRRDRFNLELEGYDKQLKEFETFGDLQEVKRYFKKAQVRQWKESLNLKHFENLHPSLPPSLPPSHPPSLPQALNSRLEEAAEKIEGFNLEEDAFDWERSQYPVRNKLVNTLSPYLKLYETICTFEDKHE